MTPAVDDPLDTICDACGCALAESEVTTGPGGESLCPDCAAEEEGTQ